MSVKAKYKITNPFENPIKQKVVLKMSEKTARKLRDVLGQLTGNQSSDTYDVYCVLDKLLSST